MTRRTTTLTPKRQPAVMTVRADQLEERTAGRKVLQAHQRDDGMWQVYVERTNDETPPQPEG